MERRQHESKLADLQSILSQKERKIQLINSDIESIQREVYSKTQTKDEMLELWKKESLSKFNDSIWIFDENSTICPNCGKGYDVSKIDEIKKDFNSRKEHSKAEFERNKTTILDKIGTDGKQKCEEIKKLNSNIEQLKSDMQETEIKITELKSEIGTETANIAMLQSEPDLESITDYKEL